MTKKSSGSNDAVSGRVDYFSPGYGKMWIDYVVAVSSGAGVLNVSYVCGYVVVRGVEGDFVAEFSPVPGQRPG